MNAKEYLSQAYSLDRQVYMTLRKAEEMRKSLYGQEIESVSETVVNYERKAAETIKRLVEVRIEIEKAISAVPDIVQREILERRYLMYQPIQSGYDKKSGKYKKGIAEDMNYSERQIYRLHVTALKYINTD